MKTLCLRCIRQDHCCNYLPPPLQHLHGFGYNGIVRIHLSTWLVLQLEGSVHSVPRDVTLPSLDKIHLNLRICCRQNIFTARNCMVFLALAHHSNVAPVSVRQMRDLMKLSLQLARGPDRPLCPRTHILRFSLQFVRSFNLSAQAVASQSANVSSSAPCCH